MQDDSFLGSWKKNLLAVTTVFELMDQEIGLDLYDPPHFMLRL